MVQSTTRSLGVYGSTSLTGKKLSELMIVITLEVLIGVSYKVVSSYTDFIYATDVANSYLMK